VQVVECQFSRSAKRRALIIGRSPRTRPGSRQLESGVERRSGGTGGGNSSREGHVGDPETTAAPGRREDGDTTTQSNWNEGGGLLSKRSALRDSPSPVRGKDSTLKRLKYEELPRLLFENNSVIVRESIRHILS